MPLKPTRWSTRLRHIKVLILNSSTISCGKDRVPASNCSKAAEHICRLLAFLIPEVALPLMASPITTFHCLFSTVVGLVDYSPPLFDQSGSVSDPVSHKPYLTLSPLTLSTYHLQMYMGINISVPQVCWHHLVLCSLVQCLSFCLAISIVLIATYTNLSYLLSTARKLVPHKLSMGILDLP